MLPDHPVIPQEHEAKFLVINDDWKAHADAGDVLHQVYVVRDASGWLTRVRWNDHQAWLTIKGPREGLSNPEFEYSIPLPDAQALAAASTGPRLSKRRYRIPSPDGVWEVDEFLDAALGGLVMAEIELPSPDTPFQRPSWVGEDVSTNPDYRNDALARRVSDALKAAMAAEPARGASPRP